MLTVFTITTTSNSSGNIILVLLLVLGVVMRLESTFLPMVIFIGSNASGEVGTYKLAKVARDMCFRRGHGSCANHLRLARATYGRHAWCTLNGTLQQTRLYKTESCPLAPSYVPTHLSVRELGI